MLLHQTQFRHALLILGRTRFHLVTRLQRLTVDAAEGFIGDLKEAVAEARASHGTGSGTMVMVYGASLCCAVETC